MEERVAKAVMIKDVVTIGPEDVVASAKLKMIRLGIGGMPVVEDGKVVGMITHRDVILIGERASTMKVGEVMTMDILTVDVGTPIRTVAEHMRKTGYQRIPVLEGDRLAGLVTQSSIIAAFLEGTG
jgi:CBS domain-containing protein